MTDDQWRSTLDDLKRERDALNPQDATARRAVDQLIKDVELHLAASDSVVSDAERKTALNRRLSETVQEFEASHPKLTLRLNQLMATLSGSGV